MPSLYEIRYVEEGRVEKRAGSRGNYYEFPDGSRLDLWSNLAWCYGCPEISHVERLATVEEMEREIADLHDPTSRRYRMTRVAVISEDHHATHVRKLIDDAHRRLRWRRARVAPPKCIRCGSANVLVFPMGQPIPHPAGAGTIVVQLVGLCSTTFNEWFFTPEGDRIPRDTSPTYWQHPALPKRTPGEFRQWVKDLDRDAAQRRERPEEPSGQG